MGRRTGRLPSACTAFPTRRTRGATSCPSWPPRGFGRWRLSCAATPPPPCRRMVTTRSGPWRETPTHCTTRSGEPPRRSSSATTGAPSPPTGGARARSLAPPSPAPSLRPWSIGMNLLTYCAAAAELVHVLLPLGDGRECVAARGLFLHRPPVGGLVTRLRRGLGRRSGQGVHRRSRAHRRGHLVLPRHVRSGAAGPRTGRGAGGRSLANTKADALPPRPRRRLHAALLHRLAARLPGRGFRDGDRGRRRPLPARGAARPRQPADRGVPHQAPTAQRSRRTPRRRRRLRRDQQAKPSCTSAAATRSARATSSGQPQTSAIAVAFTSPCRRASRRRPRPWRSEPANALWPRAAGLARHGSSPPRRRQAH